jgi:L-ascorbate metabolism protein UlaG (beta-lactamase superfamily)
MAFINLAPQFGSTPSGAHLEKIKNSINYHGGQFQNQIITTMDIGWSESPKLIYQWLLQSNNRAPEKPLPVAFSNNGVADDSGTLFTWFGHSAILLQMEGKLIMLDPMLGEAASPISFMTKRFDYQQPIDFGSLPQMIDAVILSHDHYDHLDYSSIIKLKDRVIKFYTPLGLGSHLIKWGVASEKIIELDWWGSTFLDEIEIVATPARHFSGRGLSDRNKTQWASWVIIGEKSKVYFSGDSGYGPHFKEIGDKFGPFDFAMLECGQYDIRWEAIHMLPEQTVQACLDINCNKMMPIHWGAFNLSLHAWTDPVERAIKAAKDHQVEVVTPLIGKKMSIDESSQHFSTWWRNL